MTKLTKLSLAGLLVLALAACAAQPTPDPVAPVQRLDAKTTLENAPRR